jgi:nitrite reductase/ring-hydroxylating ferredoxin subunit
MAAERVEGEAPGQRRGVVELLTRVFLGLWLIGIVGALAFYLRPPVSHETTFERVVRAGRLSELRIGEAVLIKHGVQPFYVIRIDAQHVIAPSAVCTHLRCILAYDAVKKQIVCPCDNGRYDLTGKVVSGPRRAALTLYSVTVRDGEVRVRL